MSSAFFQGESATTRRILYTPSSFAKANLLHLQEIGELQAEKPHASHRNHLQSYLFIVVLNGSGALTYRGKEHLLSAGQCAWIDCQHAYAHHTDNDPWKLRWIHFFGPNMRGIYDKYQERGGMPVFRTKQAGLFLQHWEALFDTAASFDHVRDMKINERLNGLLTLLMLESWDPINQKLVASKQRSAQHVKDYIDMHFTEKITLTSLSDKFFINKYYLTRIFRKQFGITINDYLTSVRITNAKQMLRFSSLSLEEVAIACGFQNANYFCRVFGKLEGLGPGRFRRQWGS